MISSRIAVAVCCCLLPLLIGCGEPNAELKGTVTYNGKPLNSGSIMFQCDAGPVENANIESDGTYVISGLPMGPAKVTVQVSAPPQPGPDGEITNEPGTYEPNPVMIPNKFASADTSGLTVDIKEAQQTYDIALKD